MARAKAHDHIIIDDHFIPIFLNKEYRRSIRFSMTKKGMVIRCPVLTPSKSIVHQAKLWCEKTIEKKPGAFIDFKCIDYSHEKELNLNGDTYQLQITDWSEDKDKIAWNNETIHIYVNSQYSNIQKSRVIRDLLANFAAKKYIVVITNRVHELNFKHFNVSISNVRLKNNRTNWGSCSSKGNVNLSVKLLKAPPEVIDYVIIHELAHRIEMNHSPDFWAIVGKACPGYKRAEKWLRVNGHLCSF